MDSLQVYIDKVLPGLLAFGVKLLVAVIVLLVGIKVIRAVMSHIYKRSVEHGMDVGLAQFINSFLRAVCYVILVIMIGTQFGVTTASVIAILGSSGLTLGLALQGSLSNFAGGVLILLQKPFVVGDYIVEDTHNNEGFVTRITLIYTTLQTEAGENIVIPNGTLANASLKNVTPDSIRMEKVTVGISYDSDLKRAKEIMKELVQKDQRTLKDKNISVFVDDLEDSDVKLGIIFWVKMEDYWPARRDLLEKIKLRFDEENIVIPFPQMTVSFEKDR
jgi:small conductance mechanosensitive channel